MRKMLSGDLEQLPEAVQKAILFRHSLGRKIEADDIGPEVWRDFTAAAKWYTEQYDGTFEYMLQMQDALKQQAGTLSRGQMKGILNCLYAEFSRRKYEEEGPGEEMRGTTVVSPVVPDGTYTVVRPDSTWGTYRINKADRRYFPNIEHGAQLVSLLIGKDNEGDYTGVAFLFGSRLVVWGKYKGSENIKKDLEALMKPGAYKDAGYAYALKSNRCYRCGRKLTVPASIHRGLGPICAEG
jgi:hypothetical protein